MARPTVARGGEPLLRARRTVAEVVLVSLCVLAAATPAWGADGAWDRAWGNDVIAGNAETGFEVCLVSAGARAGHPGSEPLGAKLLNPSSLAVAANGDVFVADTGHTRI